MASDARIECNCCVFRHAAGVPRLVLMANETKHPGVRGPLAALSLPLLMASLDTSVANTALPVLAEAFAAPFHAVQWIVLAYLLAITALIVSAGRLGDLVGHRRLFLAGISLFTLASLLCGVAPSLWMLLGARAVQGVGAAVMMALSLALVGETIPTERTGRAMGLLGTMSAIGTASGPSLGGLLIAGPGWRWIFLVNVPVGLLTLILAHHYLPEDGRKPTFRRSGVDPLGTLLLVATLASYALSMTRGSGSARVVPTSLLLGAGVAGALFLLAQRKASSPLVPLDTFRDRFLAAGLASGALVSAVMMSTLVVGPFYLLGALHLRAEFAGLLLSVGPLIVALVGVPAGRLADRHGAGRMTRIGLLAISLGAVALSLLPIQAGVLGYLIPIGVITTGYSLFQTANNSAVMSRADSERRGMVSGLLNLSRNLGLITGASALGAVFAIGAGVEEVATAQPEAIAAGLRTTFAAATALMAVALAMTTSPARPMQIGAKGSTDWSRKPSNSH